MNKKISITRQLTLTADGFRRTSYSISFGSEPGFTDLSLSDIRSLHSLLSGVVTHILPLQESQLTALKNIVNDYGHGTK